MVAEQLPAIRDARAWRCVGTRAGLKALAGCCSSWNGQPTSVSDLAAS
jgi:hypothetical protein